MTVIESRIIFDFAELGNAVYKVCHLHAEHFL